MKKHYLLSILMLVMMAAMWLPQSVNAQVSVWDGTYAPWTNGTGTEADPFLIENAQQLAYLTYRVNNGLDAIDNHVSNHDLYYKLMIDVDLNGSEDFQWTPIGYGISYTNHYSFGGHFDGNNHTVSGLYINSSADCVGFFGYTDGAEIENLSVNGDTVATTGQCAGGIVGRTNETIFLNCFNASNVSSSGYSGGFVGQNGGMVTIINCYNTGNVSSSDSPTYSGGILGQSSGTETIVNCYNTGNVSSSHGSGGIVGYKHRGGATITNCYNSGCATSSGNSGGIVGSGGGGSATITNCYNIGNLSSYNSGGIAIGVGNNVFNCFYLDTCGGDIAYVGYPMSADVMRTTEFVGMLNNGSCAWEQDVAPMVNDGYPILTMIVEDAYTEPATDLTASSAILHGS
ncbi:MAG: hypothetical protein IJT04_04930, partial [Bacteroidales bacterium]|nr:hypothetical protein [Bacteroidales bacterium]